MHRCPCLCCQRVASSTLRDPHFLWRAPPHGRAERPPSQAGQPSRHTPGALVCPRRAPRLARSTCGPAAGPRTVTASPCSGARLRGCRPPKTEGPNEKAAPARLPAAARGSRADQHRQDASAAGHAEVCTRRRRPAATPRASDARRPRAPLLARTSQLRTLKSFTGRTPPPAPAATSPGGLTAPRALRPARS